jgi:hypothetical protein
MRLSFDDEESLKEAAGSLYFDNPPLASTTGSDLNALLQLGVGSSSSIPSESQERIEDVCYNNPPSDPNALLRVGSSSSSMPPQERSEVT